MAYILLIFGTAIGVYALYKFMRRASAQQTKTLLLSLAIGLVVILITVLLITGRLPLAALLAAVLIPLIAALYKVLKQGKNTQE